MTLPLRMFQLKCFLNPTERSLLIQLNYAFGSGGGLNKVL